MSVKFNDTESVAQLFALSTPLRVMHRPLRRAACRACAPNAAHANFCNRLSIISKLTLMFFSCAIILLFLSGCGGETAPEPPLAYSRLVIELFESLEQRDYQLAAERIGRLKALDPENPFLGKLQEDQYCNVFVDAAQKKLDAGEAEEALGIIRRGIERYTFNRNLLAAEKLIENVIELRRRLLLLASAKISGQLRENIAAIEKMIDDYPDFSGFKPLLEQKSYLATKMEMSERQRMMFHLLCEERELRSRNDAHAEVLKALFDIENAAAPSGFGLSYSALQ